MPSKIQEVLLRRKTAFGPLIAHGSRDKLASMDLELLDEHKNTTVHSKPFPASKANSEEIMRLITECIAADLAEKYEQAEYPKHCSPCFLVYKPGSNVPWEVSLPLRAFNPLKFPENWQLDWPFPLGKLPFPPLPLAELELPLPFFKFFRRAPWLNWPRFPLPPDVRWPLLPLAFPLGVDWRFSSSFLTGALGGSLLAS